MIIKVLNDAFEDRFLVEAAFIKWAQGNDALDSPFVILEIYIVTTQAKRAGSVSTSATGIEADPSLRLRIYHGDRVFIMNNDGKTIDSKRIELKLKEVGERKWLKNQ